MNGSTGGAFPRLVRGGWDSSSSCRTPIVATAESSFVAPLGDLYFELSGILCERGGARVWAFSAANCSLSLLEQVQTLGEERDELQEEMTQLQGELEVEKQ